MNDSIRSNLLVLLFRCRYASTHDQRFAYHMQAYGYIQALSDAGVICFGQEAILNNLVLNALCFAQEQELSHE
ncbi:MAG: hypothetical protein KAI85_12925 [Halopseudomonas aestusnigri]|nr:hypothetical protein [Halopseudomonas aestusnigri]